MPQKYIGLFQNVEEYEITEADSLDEAIKHFTYDNRHKDYPRVGVHVYALPQRLYEDPKTY